jgi:hypothetical protein
VEHSPGLVDYKPTSYYRFPALFHPNSGLLYSDPYRDYYNTDTLWWVDPAGKLTNGAWLLPTFTLDVPTDMVFINLENAPASLRYADEVQAYLDGGHRVTWIGYRKDLGTIPEIDQFYTDQFSLDDDGVEIQVLEPDASCKVLDTNSKGQVWNIMVGSIQIISKNAENQPGWRPEGVVLPAEDIAYRYDDFMRDVLGVRWNDTPQGLESFSYTRNDAVSTSMVPPAQSSTAASGNEQVTVISLEAAEDSIVTIGNGLPPYGLDGTGNVVPPPARQPTAASVQLTDCDAEAVSARYASGEKIRIDKPGMVEFALEPDDLHLIKSQRKFDWAPEGLLFDTTDSRASVLIESPSCDATISAEQVGERADSASDGDELVIIEASDPAHESNFNLDTFSSLTALGNDTLLGLASRCRPPWPDGYYVTCEFDVPADGVYQFWVREGFLEMASPGRWRIDGGPWQQGSADYVPVDFEIVAQYNALEDERIIFAWYHYANIELKAGTHQLTYSVVEQRPAGLNVNLANSMRYGKLLDRFVFARGEFMPDGKAGKVKQAGRADTLAEPAINLLTNPSLELDTGGWSASRWNENRYQAADLDVEEGWSRDFWWTFRAPAQGHIEIKGLMDLGGLRIRQSYVGVRSLRMRGGDAFHRLSAQPIAVRAGQKLTAGGYMRTDQLSSDASFQIRFLDKFNSHVATVKLPPMRGTKHWQHVRMENIAVPEQAELAVFDCFLEKGEGLAWFDDMYLYRD